MSKPVDDNGLLKNMLTGEANKLEPVTPFDNSKINYDRGYEKLFGKDEREKQQEEEHVISRQNELEQKYPELKPMLMNDAIAKSWLEGWARTNLTIEEGLVKLAFFMYTEKQGYYNDLTKCMENRRPD